MEYTKDKKSPEVPAVDQELEGQEMTRKIRGQLALVVFGVLGIFLFSSELMNAIFNNAFDAMGVSPGRRIAFAFKPTVAVIYIIFASLLYTVILRYLKPLFRFIEDGEEYDRARLAAIRIPWMIIIFQFVAWFLGTTLYYYLKGWDAESGIPFIFGLPLKLAVGFPSGVYTSILFNLILIGAKQKLGIVSMREGENDTFSRNRDYFVVLAIIVFLSVNFTYIAYYFSRAQKEISLTGFYLPMLFMVLYYGAISYGLIALSKKEYFLQIDTIGNVLGKMARGSTRLDQRIEIINYNELGEIAGYVNMIMNNFYDLLKKISETSSLMADSSSSLASASQENAAHSNQQASSTAEIVSTMEELNSLSRDMGNKASNVEEVAGRVKTSVRDGFDLTQENIEKMKHLRDAYTDTINGMKNLGEHIGGIWEIVKIINGIAGQIKIIAFNAALEASAAGEAGKNFEIVASEIRRLADSTVNSTNEIRSKIGDIQHASDKLVSSSEEDTVKMQEVWEMSGRIEDVFKKILDLSEDSLQSTASMNKTVSQQIDAFEQVLITARQISRGISEFTTSVEETTRTADAIEHTVETLNAIVENSSEGKVANREKALMPYGEKEN